LVRAALKGEAVAGILVEGRAHYQATVTPINAHGRIVGALVLGARIGEQLAGRLRALTRSEVTFVFDYASIGSTLELPARETLLAALKAEPRGGSPIHSTLLELKSGDETYVTLVKPIPHANRKRPHFYVMQRSLESEAGFLHTM